MASITSFLQNNPIETSKLSVWQIVAVCGDGKLRDGNACAEQFRHFLGAAPLESLTNYIQNCLETSFPDSGSVLQDLVNELGRRLDFVVENGLYQGRVNAVGNDGVWVDSAGRSLVVEVKTSDAFRINLDTIEGYRTRLVELNRIPAASSCLIVVGRQDTGDLEAQIRGSRHAWSFRLISIDALVRLVALKEDADEETAAKTRELLLPFEYTKLDRIIELAFTAAHEVSAAAVDEQPIPLDTPTQNPVTPVKQEHTPHQIQEQLRSRIAQSYAKSVGTEVIRKSSAVFWTPDRSTRIVSSISKRYDGGEYWYGYQPRWDQLLSEASFGTYALGCVGSDSYFALPFEFIHGVLPELNETKDEVTEHWHVHLYDLQECT